MEFDEVLSHIAEDDWREAFEAYVRAGGDLNRREKRRANGWTLLHYACEHQNREAIRWLVVNDADIDAQDANGWAPLHLAVDADIDQAIQRGEEPQMVTTETLIRLGADKSLKDGRGKTPRDVAAAYGEKALALYDSAVARSGTIQ